MGKSCAPNKVIMRKIDVGNEKFKKTEGGIIVANETKSLEHKGEVLVVGNAINWVKPGDVVHHGFHSGIVFTCTEFNDNKEEEALLSLNDYEILLVTSQE